ncbi:hypothetical protein TA3x_000051 [Tundrisphaera sp. TA3]|uniref:hypothetical protein n=1 Tax=Tundrisphaera sp. TA3 TaxID=3435775 RepID=UPI003EBB998A
MAEYLLTGRDPGGKKMTVRIDADSADEAVRIAGEDGLSEIVLHTDDVGARYTRQSAVEEVISPRDFMKFRDLPPRLAGFLIVAGSLYRRSWVLYLAEAGLLLLRRTKEIPWGWFDWILVGLLLFPAAFALASQLFRGAAGRYNDLIEAASWGRWEEVLGRVDGLQGPVPAEELAFRKARALVGLGRVDEAMAVILPFGDGAAMPEWMFLSRMPEIYRPAHLPEAAKAATDRSVELAPDNATVLLDAAQAYAWHIHDPRRASELLAQARRHAISDLAQPFAARIEGLIRLEEGRPREAIPLLEEASRKLHAFRHASALIPLVLDLIHSDLALAHAGCGDIEAARRHFRAALPRLRALGYDDTIARCERAIGADAR